MSSIHLYRLLGELILEFSEFLRRLFDGDENEASNANKIRESLTQSKLTIEDIAEKPISELKPKLENIDSETLDLIIIFLYETSQKGSKNKRKNDFAELKLLENLNSQIIALIEYLNSERKTFSLERSNIKNSLQHQ